MSYFRPQQAGNIGPRTVYRIPDSTSLLSQNAGQVNSARCALSECLKLRVQSRARLRDTNLSKAGALLGAFWHSLPIATGHLPLQQAGARLAVLNSSAVRCVDEIAVVIERYDRIQLGERFQRVHCRRLLAAQLGL